MNTHNAADKKAHRRQQWETAGFLAIVALGIVAAFTLKILVLS